MPISHPTAYYSTYLAKTQGSFATLGLAEDTWALNEKILQDPGFLHQCTEADEEREVMFFDALEKVNRGMVCCVFDGTDRIQHMFWRYTDDEHPANATGSATRSYKGAIEDHYARMDDWSAGPGCNAARTGHGADGDLRPRVQLLQAWHRCEPLAD